MSEAHPLDRPVWHALTTRQRSLAVGGGRAWRYRPDVGLFAATADESVDALAELIAPGDDVAFCEARAPMLDQRFAVRSVASCEQHVLAAPHGAPVAPAIAPLTDADAPAMLALATLTRPGPFFVNTHRLGGFLGIKRDGALVAMAGERMKLPGFTEVSGVCTHPAHGGQGHASSLIRAVSARIVARGETPFMHSYADNHGANALYARLGFAVRRTMTLTFVTRA